MIFSALISVTADNSCSKYSTYRPIVEVAFTWQS